MATLIRDATGEALIAALTAGRRELPLPAHLALTPAISSGLASTLHCQELLRLVPGKRAVLRGELDGQAVLVKLFAPAASRQQARELAGHERLLAAGVPTPPLLQPARASGDCGVVLYQWLAQAEALVDMSEAPEPNRFRALLELVGRLYQAGLVQRDLHGGNFLYSGGTAWCIDPEAIDATGTRPVATDQQRDNLALLIAQFPRRWQPAALAQLCQHPLGQLASGPTALGALQERIDQRWRLRQREALAKCYRDTSAIVFEHRPDSVTGYRRSLGGPDLERFFADPDAVMAGGQMLKDGNSATVVRCRLDGRDIVIKRYNIKGAGHWLRRCWRPSRAWVSWGNAFRLQLLGLKTPPPVAFMERRHGPLRGRAWYLCDYVPGEELLSALAQRDPTATELADLQAWFRLARQEQLVHGDLKATNLFTAAGHIWLLDLDAMRAVRSPRRWQRLFSKDVARFARNWDAATPWLAALGAATTSDQDTAHNS